jgi:predicted acylesterase/phospholipase RssA
LENILKDTFGSVTLSQIKKKCFVVTAEVSQTEIIPYLLRTYETPSLYDSRNTVGNFFIPASTHDCRDMPAWSACLATSSAPTYFSPYEYKSTAGSKSLLFVDGGIVANNPMELAIQECFALYPDAKLRCIVSLGTGTPAIGYLSDTKTILHWKNTVVNLVTDSESIYKRCNNWLGSAARNILMFEKYYPDRSRILRWNPPLGDMTKTLDDTRPGSLNQMQAETKSYMLKQQQLGDIAWLKSHLVNK